MTVIDKRYKKGTKNNWIKAKKFVQKLKRDNKYKDNFDLRNYNLSQFKLTYLERNELIFGK